MATGDRHSDRCGGVRRLAQRGVVLAFVLAAGLVGASSALAAPPPAQPAVVGSVTDSVNMSGALATAVSGHYAYTVAYWSGRVVAVDISNPAHPAIVGYTPSTPALTDGSTINISGNYAFVVAKNRNGPCLPGPIPSCNSGSNDDGTGNSLTVVDISNPTSPTIVGAVTDPNKLFGAYGVAVSGHYAYVAYQGYLTGQPGQPDTSSGGFSVIDLNNLAGGVVANIDNGPVVGGKNWLWHATSVNISGHYAYVTGFYDRRLTIIDISNPLAPKFVTSIRDALNLWNAADVAVQGNYAYVADQNGPSTPSTPTVQFSIVNVANPAKPVVVSAVSNAVLAGAYRIRVRGNFAYVAASGGNAVGAIDVSNPNSPRLAGYVQNTTQLYDTDGLDVDSTGRYVVSNAPLQNGQAKQTWPLFPLTPGGPTNTGTVNVIDMVPTPIAVTIDPTTEPANPSTSTSASFGFSVSDAVSTVQCSLDGAPLGNCTTPTTQTYSSLANGSHTFTVQAGAADGTTSTASYTWIVGAAPRNSVAPTESGTASLGGQLSAGPGTWSGYPAPVISYQWQRCDQNGLNCTPISSATGQTYTVQSGDVGSTVAVAVTGTNSLGSSTVVTGASAVITSPPADGPGPTVSGQATVGGHLTGSPGTWSGYPTPSLAYQWLRCDQAGQNCNSITGATGTTYAPVAADAGSTLVFQVTGSNSGGMLQTTAPPTAIVTQAPQNTTPPSVSGSATPGQTMTASPGSWSGYPTPTLAYQWQQCDQNGVNCTVISGATGSTYVVQPSDDGFTLAVLVTATNSLGSSPMASAPSALVTQAPTYSSSPSVAGQATVGGQLTGSAGAWSGYPAPSLVYQWLRCDQAGQNCNSITGATGTTYAPVAADAGSTLVFQVTGSNSAGSLQTSAPATAIVTEAPQNNGPPSVSGSASPGQTLTASPGSWSGYPTPTLAYGWQQCDAGGNNCTPISGANGPTYVVQSTDSGFTLEVVVTATNSVGSLPMASGPSQLVGGGPAVNVLPSVSGQATVGGLLTGSAGSWSGVPTPTLADQWQRCDLNANNCVNIPNATSLTYAPVAADAASTLELMVTATNPSGTTHASSAPTAAVTQAPQNTGVPGVSGSARVGQTLTASPGSWSGYPAPTLAYGWQQCDAGGNNCTPISGANGPTYVVQSTDSGLTLEVVVTATNSVGSSPMASSPSAVVTQAPTFSSSPTVTGQATVGGLLTGSAGAWSGYPTPTLAYQWQRCDLNIQNCTAITNATGLTYAPVAADAGSTLIFSVTGSNSVGSTPASSLPTAAVTQAPSGNGPPVITGPVTLGQPATASGGSWSGYPAPTLTYQWQQCDPSGQHCAPISGATTATYTPQPGDVGLTLVVTVTAQNGVGSPASQTSLPSAVSAAPPSNQTSPTVSGTAQLGQTLTTTAGTWSGNPTGFAYQWQRCNQSGQSCAPIAGATAPTYVLTGADVGSTVLATVTATNAGGQGSPASSSPTAIVTGAPANTTAPSLSGSITLGGTVSASPGQWSAYPAPTFSYVWQRCSTSHCATISGATASTYVAQRSEVGFTIGVIVTATNSLGSSAAAEVQTAIVTGVPLATLSPVVSGTVATGNVLTATTGTWSGYPAPTFGPDQWQSCNTSGNSCVTIPNTNSTSYTVTSADLGSTLRFGLYGTNSLGSTFSRSNPTTLINFAGILHGTVSNGPVSPAPTLSLGVVAPKATPLSQVSISPPTDVAFVIGRGGHVKGLTVTDGHGRRLAYTARISHGSLIITLRRYTTTLRVIIGKREITVSRRLALRVRGAHSTLVPIKITYSEAGQKTQHLTIKVKAT